MLHSGRPRLQRPHAGQRPACAEAATPTLMRWLCRARRSYLTWTPEIAREITNRWISDVPSKMS